MTRVGSPATPIFAAEPAAERGPAAASGPFRAALRAARKTDRSEEGAGDTALAAQAQAAERAAAERATAPRPRDDEPRTARTRGSTVPIAFAARPPARMTQARADEAAPPAPPPGAAAHAGVSDAPMMTPVAAPAGSAAPPAGAPGDDAPVAAWLAAAVGRAFGAFGGNAGSAGAPAAAAALGSSAPSAQAQLTGGGALAAALSPLEQAVHDLLDQLADDAPESSDPGAHGADLAALHALGAAAPAASDGPEPVVAPVRAALPSPPPELPGQPSHLHLVLDDGPERVVMTVAMRGSDVHVALRASDDATSAALARNAASLDHAMRARGLALGELITERDPRDRRQSPDRQPGEPQPDAEPFELEEMS